MNTYKITNITNLAHKRDSKFNSVINIEYVDNRMKKSFALKPGESVFLSVQSLPLSIHRLRIKKLVDVVEVSTAELNKAKPPKASTPPKKPKAKTSVTKKPVEKPKTPVAQTTKKTTTKKKTVEEK